MIAVACDVCRLKHEVSDNSYGNRQRCKECNNTFEISAKNAATEDRSDDGELESGWAKTVRILRGTTSGIGIVIGCVWMISLLFRDPWVQAPATAEASSSWRSSGLLVPQPKIISHPNLNIGPASISESFMPRVNTQSSPSITPSVFPQHGRSWGRSVSPGVEQPSNPSAGAPQTSPTPHTMDPHLPGSVATSPLPPFGPSNPPTGIPSGIPPGPPGPSSFASEAQARHEQAISDMRKRHEEMMRRHEEMVKQMRSGMPNRGVPRRPGAP